LDENLVAESVTAFKWPVSFSAKEAVGVADSVKGFVKPSTLMTGFLRRGFLNPSPAVKALTPLTSLLELVMSSSTPKVKEVRVVGIPSPLGGWVTPIVRKGDDSRVTGLSQSQKWPIGFGPSGEVVLWEQGDEVWDGEDGDSPYPLGALPPDEDMNPSLAFLKAIVEDFHQGGKAAHPKTKR